MPMSGPYHDDAGAAPGFDAHTHLDFPAFDVDRGEALARARVAGVGGFAIASADPRDWGRVRDVARQWGQPWSVGVHPWWVDPAEPPDALVARVAAHEDADAIGEIGLDAVRRGVAPLDAQERAFRAQLAYAVDVNRPVVVHAVRAAPRVIAVLRDVGVPERGGLVHGFSGDLPTARALIGLDLTLSFGPDLLRRPHLREVVAAVPDGRFTLETDAPDRPVDGDRGEPRDVVRIAEVVAAIRGVDVARILAVTGRTARRLFGVPEPAATSYEPRSTTEPR